MCSSVANVRTGQLLLGCKAVDVASVLVKGSRMGSTSPIGRISYREAPAANTYPIKTAWKRLKRWSAANLPQDGDEGEDCLPASDEQLREFEIAIGAKLPKEVRDSYRVYNGQCAGAGIVYGLAVVPLSESLAHWQGWVDGYKDNVEDDSAAGLDSSCSSFPDGFVRPVYFDNGWIPLTYDSGGNYVAIDLNPGPRGTRGQVIVFGRDDVFHTVLALSWGQFLTDLANELESGNFRLDMSDPDYPDFTPDDPHKKHFHSIGICWSRGKLGLRKLSAADQRQWDKWQGK
jgi:cell wall assembly regulator SMI1